jgi:GTPase Era involved in 16S rRNA processing
MPQHTAVEVIDLAIKAADAYHRGDLAGRLRQSRTRTLDPEIRVLVVGEFKQGKSQLVNALITAPVCPVDDDIATAVPTVVRFAEKPSAFVVMEDTGRHRQSREPVAIDRLAGYVCEVPEPGTVRHVEVCIPRSLLADGLTIVDTPGVGGSSVTGRAAMAGLAVADAVLFVSAAAQEYTAAELEFLRQATELCPNVLCVLTKIDLYPAWRDILELDRARLAEAGIRAELLPVSSALRLHAAKTDDPQFNMESGFPALVHFLRDQVVARAEHLARRSAAHDVLIVTEQLAAAMNAELDARRDPERAQALVADLEQAEQRCAQLKQRSARWQQTLNDGIADLIADIDHDLRDRLREVVRVAEAELDATDPAKVADQFTGWLQHKVSTCTSATFVWMMQRARWLSTQVAEHFADEGGQVLPEIRIGDAGALSSYVTPFEPKPAEKFGISQKLLAGMRGGYGGTLMFGMLGTLAGLALINPVSVAAGLLLGGKTVKEERKRVLQRRQAEAKTAVRRHIDDVIFQVGKHCRDLLRQIQRTLRDHFTSHAEQLHRSLSESLVAARNAVKADKSERDSRISDLTAELQRIGNLDRMARQLTAGKDVASENVTPA